VNFPSKSAAVDEREESRFGGVVEAGDNKAGSLSDIFLCRIERFEEVIGKGKWGNRGCRKQKGEKSAERK
jgi:hypothetical protein